MNSRPFPTSHTDELASETERMIGALNSLFRRRRPGWKTPGEAWKMETPPVLDRQSLREEVRD